MFGQKKPKIEYEMSFVTGFLPEDGRDKTEAVYAYAKRVDGIYQHSDFQRRVILGLHLVAEVHPYAEPLPYKLEVALEEVCRAILRENLPRIMRRIEGTERD